MAAVDEREEITPAEALHLGAVDTAFFEHFFFPRAFRQQSAPFHREMDHALASPLHRYTSFKCFRGSAKTTKLRSFTAKRIGYAISRTILFVSASQEHSVRSVLWLKRAVTYNHLFAQTFGLRKGDKWSDQEIEIICEPADCRIRLIALGITGQIRGVNIEDYRPDLIVVDDPDSEETSATPEQRAKLQALFFGALQKSLAPRSEAPDSMMVLAQTPFVTGDIIDTVEQDPSWYSLAFSCFTAEHESTWPARWSTEDLRAEKQAHIERGDLALWMREMEVTIVSQEEAAFRPEWLQFWDILPEGMATFIGIDPTPPPKENQSVYAAKKLDDACILVIGLHRGRVFVCDYYVTKSPNPEEFITKVFELVRTWRPLKVCVETTLFQRMLKHQLEREQHRRNHYFLVEAVEDRRKKETRIRQALNGRGAARTIYVHRSHTALIEQWNMYPNVAHDDILDAFTIALSGVDVGLEDDVLEGDYSVLSEEQIPDEPEWRGAP